MAVSVLRSTEQNYQITFRPSVDFSDTKLSDFVKNIKAQN